jgi:molybdopterin adenylyltransferase
MNPGGPYRAGILTISDRGARGERSSDPSGDAALDMLNRAGLPVDRREVVPDNPDRIREALIRWVDMDGLSLIVTSGGTGLAPTDVTPQATREVLDYEVPGIAEAMRAAGLGKTPHAMLSRALAGVRGRCLILNLPGSPKAVRESLAVVIPALEHALDKLHGDPSDCAA